MQWIVIDDLNGFRKPLLSVDVAHSDQFTLDPLAT